MPARKHFRYRIFFQKAFLFQAKKGITINSRKAVEQATSMENIAPGGSLMIVYGRDGYPCMHADQFLHTDQAPAIDICDYIVNDFFECFHGTEGMRFDIDSRSLIINDSEIYAPDIKFAITHDVREGR